MEAGTTVRSRTAAAKRFLRRICAGRIGEKRAFVAKCRPKHKKQVVDFRFDERRTLIPKTGR